MFLQTRWKDGIDLVWLLSLLLFYAVMFRSAFLHMTSKMERNASAKSKLDDVKMMRKNEEYVIDADCYVWLKQRFRYSQFINLACAGVGPLFIDRNYLTLHVSMAINRHWLESNHNQQRVYDLHTNKYAYRHFGISKSCFLAHCTMQRKHREWVYVAKVSFFTRLHIQSI